MAFERDWEEFFGKMARGAPLSPEEDRHARAVRALRASVPGAPAADPVFLDSLSGALAREYARSYGARPSPRADAFAPLRPFAPVAAAYVALASSYYFLSADPGPQAAAPYAAAAYAGFLALAAAAYAGLGVAAAALSLWRARACRAPSFGHASAAAAFVLGSLAVSAALGIAYGAAASLGAELSFGAGFLERAGLAQKAVFAASCAASAFALVASSASVARIGPRALPRLVAAAAAAPWFPAICAFLAFEHPSSALANGSFLALSALAMAAALWPFPGAAHGVDRFFAASAVLAVSFPAYVYFLLPRDATKAEVAACCAAVLAWAAASAFSAVRRRGLPSFPANATM